MCDLERKNGEDDDMYFEKEYGKERIILIKNEVKKEKELEEELKKKKEKLGNIEIVIKKEGIVGEDRWEAAIEVNVKGVVRGKKLEME
jgi:NADP-dependent 3-hydroxy acid dehydrogenase YdfG